MFFRVESYMPAQEHGVRPRGADGAAPSTETEPWFPPRYGFRFGPVLKLTRLRGRGLGEATSNGRLRRRDRDRVRSVERVFPFAVFPS